MSNTTNVRADVDTELYNRFMKIMPQLGATAWFIRTSLEEFCDEMEDKPSMDDHLRSSVRRVVERRRTGT